MNKQDIDQSHTSWLIYSDYLEENNQLALAEQIRFELDYKPFSNLMPYRVTSVGGVGPYFGVGGNTFSYVGSGVGGIVAFYVGVGGGETDE